ncbi:MAG TPA: hypothetical protein VFX41_09150 [Actinomycetales bacterium]|jgi:hypothetical protein|nr:hypothetical protein [Actinomycetales bacterium]
MGLVPVLGLDEIDAQAVELLPRRETLFINVNVAPVVGVNLAFAVNAASIGASANALAAQQLASLGR